MKDLNNILSQIKTLLPFIKNKYDVTSLAVFGSYVKNRQSTDSDLDLLVTFSKTPTLIQFLELKNFLSDNLNLNVDLVMKDSLKPGIGKRILSEAISI